MKKACVVLALAAGCAGPDVEQGPRPGNVMGNNVFFYYKDLDAAARFYEDVLGLAVVADYGFAKVLRVADTSYLTLVDGASGMHSTDEPKTVAIALVTDELEGWYRYLKERDVSMRGELDVGDGTPHDGFVAYDPEGYYLELERFNPHPENEAFLPLLSEVEPVYTDAGPPELGFRATILWLYYEDLEAAERFYRDVLGFERTVDQGWAKILETSASGYIGLVDGARGMHQATTDKAVTVSFLTDEVDAWFEYLSKQESKETIELRHQEVLDEGFVRVFVAYDPENYFLEFDTFTEHEDNVELLKALHP